MLGCIYLEQWPSLRKVRLAPRFALHGIDSLAIRGTQGTGVRLAAVFNDHVRSITLRDEVSKRIFPHAKEQLEFPRLVVRIESAKLVLVTGGATFEVTARSQAITAPDKKGVQMTHHVTTLARNVDEWLASNGKRFREDLDAVVDALSSNVVSVYMPEHLTAPGRFPSGQ